MKKFFIFLFAFSLAIASENANTQMVGSSISNPGAGGGGGVPSGPAGGDLSGTYPNPSVASIGGNAVTLGGSLTTTGAFSTALTVSGATSLTLPTTGTVLASGSAAGGDLTGTYPNPTLAASITSGAHTFNASQTISTATTTTPAWVSQITGDTTPRIALGLSAVDVPQVSFGPGNATRDLFLTRASAASLQIGASDAAAPVAQTVSVQSVVTGTSNIAGAAFTITGSRGTGTGAGGSIIFQTAAASTTGSTPNSLAQVLTLNSAAQTLVSNTTNAALPALAFAGDAATGLYQRTTSAIDFAVGGVVRYEMGTSYLRSRSDVAFGWTNSGPNSAADTAISRSAAGTLAIGTGAQGSVAGNFNAATGILNALATDAGHTTATVCTDSTTGQLYKGSGTVGVCLGTSSARYKSNIEPMNAGLDQIMALQPKTYRYIKGYGDDGGKRQNGFLAEDVAKTLVDIVGYDAEGRPNTIDLVALIPVLVKAVQELNARVK